jgi:hypothetical protein
MILKIVPKDFWQFFGITRSMNYGTFHINTIFDGFGMGSTGFFSKSRVSSVSRA